MGERVPNVAATAIKFGTSGWRGVMADDFTFAGVRRAAAAVAGHLLTGKKSAVVIVGYDTRFFSEDFARQAAAVLKAKGCRVLLCKEATPTPAIAHAILHGKLDGGVNITASHNPSEYNGIKFSGPEGGPAMPEVTRDIEARAAKFKNDEAQRPENEDDFERIDPREPYFDQLQQMVRFDVLERAQKMGIFVCDALHGCGAGWLDRILAAHRIPTLMIHANRDVLFDGSGPDPSEANLAPLKKKMLEEHAAAGLATDGDADRFGILDRDGSFVSPNHILALVFDYLLETRGAGDGTNGHKLGASRSVATTHLLDAVAKLHGVRVYETPVGFKYVGSFLRDGKIAMGGEESAGLTIAGHVPEKDGILACLLVAEMIGARQASLGEQLRNLFKRIGREYWPIRLNLHLAEDMQERATAKMREDRSEFAGRRVARVSREDGLKLIFEDGAWLLMRPSGTEPLIRVYTEAATLIESKNIAEEARAWIHA
ncbi:MAG: phosphoglucomutase/phosphomannomutase family protein [Candidatus Acidiferrales bacterium]